MTDYIHEECIVLFLLVDKIRGVRTADQTRMSAETQCLPFLGNVLVL